MTILVDADACPVKEIVVEIAKRRRIPVTMVADWNHRIDDGYSQLVQVDPGADSADFAIVDRARTGDVVVTQDFGLAAMALARGARAIHPTGRVFTEMNIDGLLLERHLSAAARRSGRRTSGPKKRTGGDDDRFREAFERLLDEPPAEPGPAPDRPPSPAC